MSRLFQMSENEILTGTSGRPFIDTVPSSPVNQK